MNFGSLFAGIGGFDLGLERAGMTCKWQVEIDPFCRKVLEKHWPHVKRYDDIKTIDSTIDTVDLICGGFPCQPFSHAGKRKGKEDNRYLWPEMLRVIAQKRPAWVLGENVAGIVGMELDRVLLDLESEGYATRAFIIPACAVDARHRRDRVWIVAHAMRPGGQQIPRGAYGDEAENERRTAQHSDELAGSGEDVADAAGEGRGSARNTGQAVRESGAQQRSAGLQWCEWLPEPNVGRVANGVPHRVDRLRALGNAVVPQILEILGRAIIEANNVIQT